MDLYFDVLKKYAVFAGRAGRKEYWMFYLFNVIIVFILGFVEGMFGSPGIIANLYFLAVLIPSIAVGVRRMHDTDHSGWWLLFPIVNLIFAIMEGTKGDNNFGPDPNTSSAS